MSKQLSFPQPIETSYAAENYYPGEPSAVARGMLADAASWPAGKLLILGAEGAGKTHLLHIWAMQNGGLLADPMDLPRQSDSPVVVDDADQVAGDQAAEEALFHLHNNLAAAGLPLLLSASQSPLSWGLQLPDLASRMEATATATIEAPDDATLTAILIKLMGDRQLSPAPNLVDYITRRMGRSYAEAGRIVNALDGLSLSEKRNITTTLAARVLDGETE
ncbi:MAG: DnaA/Hda family protein [Pseudomonadota bacterium]